MNASRFLIALGDTLHYLAERLTFAAEESQVAAVTSGQGVLLDNDEATPTETSADRVLATIRAGGNKGIAASELSRRGRSMTGNERKRIIQDLLENGFIRQETIRTDGRSRTVFIAHPV